MILVRGGWVAGSYSDTKTHLSQVGLDWDWPTGLSLAKVTELLVESLTLRYNPMSLNSKPKGCLNSRILIINLMF